jgi:hypothetical protein
MEPVATVGVVLVIVFTATGLAATLYAIMKKDRPGERTAWEKVLVRSRQGNH